MALADVLVSCLFVRGTLNREVPMRVLGLDPGLRVTGWGILDSDGSKISHAGNGECRPVGESLGERLASLHELLTEVVSEFVPEAAAIEKTFVNRDGAGTLKLGHARAVAMLVPAQAGLLVAEYAPNSVKKAVVGVGHADKQQVDHMVRMFLPGADIAGSDAADALAVALTHVFVGTTSRVLEEAIARSCA